MLLNQPLTFAFLLLTFEFCPPIGMPFGLIFATEKIKNEKVLRFIDDGYGYHYPERSERP